MKIAGQEWERHRRGRHAVMLCPGRWLQDVRVRCPYSVVIAEPGHEVQEPMAVKAAEDHWNDNHAGGWGDQWRAANQGRVLDLSALREFHRG